MVALAMVEPDFRSMARFPFCLESILPFREEQNGSLALSSRERQLKSVLISGDIRTASVQQNARAERFRTFNRRQ